MESRKQGTTLFTGILVLIAILVVIQLWLVAAALDALESGATGVLLPAAIASVILFLVSAGLLLHGLVFDRRLRHGKRDG